MKTYEVAGKKVVFIDESGFAHDMPRTHGYAAVGERCFGKHDWHAKGRTNVIADQRYLHIFCILLIFRVETQCIASLQDYVNQ